MMLNCQRSLLRHIDHMMGGIGHQPVVKLRETELLELGLDSFSIIFWFIFYLSVKNIVKKFINPFHKDFWRAIPLELSNINNDQAMYGSKFELRLSSAPTYYDKYPIMNHRFCRKYGFWNLLLNYYNNYFLGYLI